MRWMDAVEIAYKNGIERGKQEAKTNSSEMLKAVIREIPIWRKCELCKHFDGKCKAWQVVCDEELYKQIMEELYEQ